MTVKPSSILACGALAALLASCEKQQAIQSYRVPKDNLRPAMGGQGMGGQGMGAMGTPGAPVAGDMAAATSAPSVSGESPANWTAQPLSTMRQASFLAKDSTGASADISLIILRGQAGGDLENINRWRGQIGLDPIAEADLAKETTRVETPLGALTVVDFEGKPQDGGSEKDGRILAALGNRNGDAWFFKMRGNSGVVTANRDAFLKWIASVKPSSAPAPAVPQTTAPSDSTTLPAGHPPMGGASATPAPQGLPAGHPPMGGAAAAPAINTTDPNAPASALPAVHDAKVTWSAPASWTAVPGAQMRYASFSINGPDGTKGDLSVIALPGTGGSDLGNVNRWRQQVGQDPLDEVALATQVTRVNAKNAVFSLTRCSGASSDMLAAWLRQDQNCWFFKLTGPRTLIDQENARFVEFLQSVQFPTADKQ